VFTGWQISMDGNGANALAMTIWPQGKPFALLHHFDQGSQQAVPAAYSRQRHGLFEEPICSSVEFDGTGANLTERQQNARQTQPSQLSEAQAWQFTIITPEKISLGANCAFRY
jgi:hypothetical protein